MNLFFPLLVSISSLRIARDSFLIYSLREFKMFRKILPLHEVMQYLLDIALIKAGLKVDGRAMLRYRNLFNLITDPIMKAFVSF